jgi:EAL and modified HD-GYP domain-containing signal transduction protein
MDVSMRYEERAVVGRQGIYDEKDLVGFELLFRQLGPLVGATRPTGDQMTAAVVYSALSIGLNSLAGDHLIFCNADRGVLTGDMPLMLPPQRTVVEIVDGVVIDDEIVAGCRKLVEAGYALALDGFVPGSGQEALLPIAAIAKIDLLVTPPAELAAIVARCKAHSVRPLAEKVESRDDLPRLRKLGFELFQGYALDKPAVIEGRTLAPGAAGRINAAVQVMGSDGDFDALEAVIKRDPALAHQVMLLASIGRMGESRRRLNSIREALVLAGTAQIRRWLALLLARPSSHSSDMRDAFLTTLIRARVCELLARRAGLDPGLAYAAGMLSTLDALLQVTSEEVADKLAISDDLREAAFGGTSSLGLLVQDVSDSPRHAAGRPSQAPETEKGTRSGLPIAEFDSAYATAFGWAVEAAGALDS